jgi:hypothetical protein
MAGENLRKEGSTSCFSSIAMDTCRSKGKRRDKGICNREQFRPISRIILQQRKKAGLYILMKNVS